MAQTTSEEILIAVSCELEERLEILSHEYCLKQIENKKLGYQIKLVQRLLENCISFEERDDWLIELNILTDLFRISGREELQFKEEKQRCAKMLLLATSEIEA